MIDQSTIKKFAEDWIEYWEISNDPSINTRTFRKAIEADEHPLAYVSFQEADYIKNQPEAAWRLLLELVAKAKSDLMLAIIAAGPLEDLLNKYPDQFIEEVEEEARKDAQFRKCLTRVWENGIPLPIWKCIVAACGNTPRL